MIMYHERVGSDDPAQISKKKRPSVFSRAEVVGMLTSSKRRLPLSKARPAKYPRAFSFGVSDRNGRADNGPEWASYHGNTGTINTYGLAALTCIGYSTTRQAKVGSSWYGRNDDAKREVVHSKALNHEWMA